MHFYTCTHGCWGGNVILVPCKMLTAAVAPTGCWWATEGAYGRGARGEHRRAWGEGEHGGVVMVAVFPRQAVGPIQASQAETLAWGWDWRKQTSFIVNYKGFSRMLHCPPLWESLIGCYFNCTILKSRSNFLLYCQTMKDRNSK